MVRGLKSVLGFGLATVAGVAMIGCSALNPTDKDEVTITLGAMTAMAASSSGEVSQNITGTVVGNQVITAITAIIKDSAGTQVGAATTSYLRVDKNSLPADQKSINLATDLALKVVVISNSVVNGTYSLEVSATAGSVTSSKSATFVVSGGVAGSLLSVTATDCKIANIFGPDTGSYDLVNSVRVPAGSSATIKDLMDMSLVGQGFAGELGSGNGALFAASNATAYANATAASVKTAADLATATSIAIAANTVFVVKLGGSRGYAIVTILTYSPTAGASTTNKGEATFAYKFTATGI